MFPQIPPENLPPNRSFGLLFTALFTGVGLWGLYRGWDLRLAGGLLVAGGLTGCVTLALPALLAPFNKAWYLLGMLLGRIVGPIVMGVLFFAVLTPVALAGRLLGRDELRLKRRGRETYWIERRPARAGRRFVPQPVLGEPSR